MDTTAAAPDEYQTDVRDVRRVPLARIARAGVGSGLARILPGAGARPVPVAAFNSSI